MTPAKIKQIQQIIRKYVKILKYAVSGENKLTVELMKKYKIPVHYQPLIEYSFKYGALNEKVGGVLGTMDLSEVDKILPEFKLTSTMNKIIEYAKLNAAGSIDTLGNTIINRTTNLLSQTGLTEQVAVKETISTGIEQQQLRGYIKQALQDATADYKRDWDRVCVTEMMNAKNQGEAEAILTNETILSDKGSDTLVFKRTAQDVNVCIHCKNAYLEADGVTPKVYKLSDLIANGNNHYKKVAEWEPVVGTMHPNCRCTLQVLPDNMEFNGSGELVPKKKDTTEIAV